ncbi:MAG: hypothetical protein H0X31_13990 [Nostocaceae cyanobacterium]|nr:hypothetical protein [Nostocaceae cyanobacterium]
MVNFGLNSASFLAQVNLGTNSASILGIFLAVAGAGLYFLRTVRPELARDQDIFFAAVGVLCGFILIFQGWRLDPILQFNQLLLTGATVFFAFDSVRLRGIATEQAKRNTPIEDMERKVSNRYKYNDTRVEAELEELPYDDDEEPPVRPRIRSSRDTRSSRDEYLEDETPRRNERRPSSGERPNSSGERPNSSGERPNSSGQRPNSGGERPVRGDRTRRPGGATSRPVNRTNERYPDDEWGGASSSDSDWDDTNDEGRKPRRPSSGGSPRSERPVSESEDASIRPRRRRPGTESNPRQKPQDDDAIPVDYKPIKQRDDEADNSPNFEET